MAQASSDEKRNEVSKATIGADGFVHILRKDGTEFIAPREGSPMVLDGDDGMQASVNDPVVAGDMGTVAWTANFANCCTSYPIPLLLIIYRDGRIVQRMTTESAQPIWTWHFLAGGARVAYYSETVHGGSGRRCELREVRSGKLLDFWEADAHSRGKRRPIPGWAALFRSDLIQ